MRRLATLCFVLIFCLVGCNNTQTTHCSYTIGKEGWAKTHSLYYDVAAADSLHNCKLLIVVRNNDKYAYQQLPLLVTHNLPDATVWQIDTIVFQVADKNGKWLSKGWSGIYESWQTLKEFDYLRCGKYTIKIDQLTGEEYLHGITDISVVLENSK